MNRTHHTLVSRHDEDETDALVKYTYRPGCPERGPTYDCGGEPAEPPEVEILKVTVGGVQIEPTEAEFGAWTTWIMNNHEPEEPEYEEKVW